MTSRAVFELYEKLRVTALGPMFQRFGRKLIHNGLKMQGDVHYADRQVPSLRGKNVNGRHFDMGLSNFVAPNSVIIGNVNLSKNSSVWFGATLNADKGEIFVGENSQIQDNAVVSPGEGNVIIGRNVTVSSNVVLNSCILKDGVTIGPNATIGEGCVLEEGSIIVAGSQLAAGTVVPANECWAGNPGEVLRQVKPNEKENLQDQHQEYVELANIYCEHTEMSFRQWMDHFATWKAKEQQDMEGYVLERYEELGLPTSEEEVEYYDVRHEFLRNYHSNYDNLSAWNEDGTPFEYENNSFPEAMKMYRKNYESYEGHKRYFDEKPTEAPVLRKEAWETPLDAEPWTQKY